MNMLTDRRIRNVAIDIGIIVLSIFLAILLVNTDVLHGLLNLFGGLGMLANFIAGMFFTSIFTTAPAIVALGSISITNSILQTALIGAVGAVFGDLIIFHFIRDRFSEDLMDLFSRSRRARLSKIVKTPLVRYINFIIGAIIIGSPLPDELGISLLGFNKMKTRWFVVISFVFNFLGIILIGLVARQIN